MYKLENGKVIGEVEINTQVLKQQLKALKFRKQSLVSEIDKVQIQIDSIKNQITAINTETGLDIEED